MIGQRQSTLFFIIFLLFAICASAQKKTFAIRYNTMVGTSTDDIRFSQNGTEFVMCYPPGIPILSPGEMVTKDATTGAITFTPDT